MTRLTRRRGSKDQDEKRRLGDVEAQMIDYDFINAHRLWHAPDRGGGHRHRPARDAPDKQQFHQRSDPLPLHEKDPAEEGEDAPPRRRRTALKRIFIKFFLKKNNYRLTYDQARGD